MGDLINNQASQDFDRAKSKALFSQIFSLLRPEKKELMSFYDIKSLVKPHSQVYKGMKTVEIAKIVGSEGRYQDFNQTFLPKREHLRTRWTNVDKAYLRDVQLPPIRLYKLGDAYFVRDGNHRVSVARSQDMYSIDAEVVELSTQVKFTPEMSMDDLRKEVLKYERKRILEQTKLNKFIPTERIFFSSPGRYEEMLRHILGHKYFINQGQEEEIPFQDAAKSWYVNIYRPIAEIISDNELIQRFPGRFEGDLYVWIVKRWDSLKEKFGQNYPLEKAAREYSEEHGKNGIQRFFYRVKKFFKRK